MYYFKVKHEADGTKVLNKKSQITRTLIADELYTQKEFTILINNSINKHELESSVNIVQIPKTKIYWIFGVRFADHDYRLELED